MNPRECRLIVDFSAVSDPQFVAALGAWILFAGEVADAMESDPGSPLEFLWSIVSTVGAALRDEADLRRLAGDIDAAEIVEGDA